MPANPKYLNKSPWQQGAKITAGLIGGYCISALLHMILALVLPFHQEVLVASIVTLFLVWCTLMIIPYLFENGWKVWGLYLIIIALLYTLYLFCNHNNPFL
ncbi:conserved membrane hypothetical protein [Tenacibaculum litopenaei]|uniref:hypothetical protein n=1 Tax=Tenacibaculum litopenaei TaxID=396016 RepID=UPI00389324E5